MNFPQDKQYQHTFFYLFCACIFFIYCFFYFLTVPSHNEDETIISYRYAKNFVSGLGLRPYENGPQIEGYSNPLLVFSSAFIAFLSGIEEIQDYILIGNVIMFCSGFATLVLITLWGRKSGEKYWYAPALMMSVSWPLYDYIQRGFETPFYTLLLLCSVYFFSTGKSCQALLFALLSGLSRPEAPGIAGILILLFLYDSHRDGVLKKGVVQTGVLFILPVSLFLAFRLYYFGDILPNTVYAKTITDNDAFSILKGLAYLGKALIAAPYLSILFLLTLIRSFKSPMVYRYESVLFMSQVIFCITVGGDESWLGYWRFLAPILPIMYRSSSLLFEFLQKITFSRKSFIAPVIICLIPLISPHHFYHENGWYNGFYQKLIRFNPQIKWRHLLHPGIWLDRYAGEEISNRTPNHGAGYRMGCYQSAAFILPWKGDFDDYYGLLSCEFSRVDHIGKDLLVAKNPPDLVVLLNFHLEKLKGNPIDVWVEIPSFITLNELGFRPVFMVQYWYHDADFIDVFEGSKARYALLALEREPVIQNYENTDGYKTLELVSNRGGKISGTVAFKNREGP